MINAALLVSICLLLAVSSSQAPPSWTRDNSIDAGESVAIDVTHYFANTPTNKTAPITFSLTQAFNKTDFTVIPRVALVHLSFDFYYVSSMSMGYRININTITTKNVTYKVDLVGVKTCGLHFMYIAVSPIYDAYYFISFYNQSCTITAIQSPQRRIWPMSRQAPLAVRPFSSTTPKTPPSPATTHPRRILCRPG